MNNNKVYLLTANLYGCDAGYGCEIFVIGIFSTKDSAKKVEDKIIIETGFDELCFNISELEIDEEYNVYKNPLYDASFSTEICLGGYIE